MDALISYRHSPHEAHLLLRVGKTSPYQALVRPKMNHAEKRLAEGTLPLKAIGTDFGLPDPYHFSRVFKRTLGLSPKAFRESYHRGGGP